MREYWPFYRVTHARLSQEALFRNSSLNRLLNDSPAVWKVVACAFDHRGGDAKMNSLGSLN